LDYFIDIISIGFDIQQLVTDPSWQNAGYLAGDILLGALPFVPAGIGPAAKGGKVFLQYARYNVKSFIRASNTSADAARGLRNVVYHGNDLRTLKPAKGYVLENRSTGEILKYGETTRGYKRYSEIYLKSINAEMRFMAKGTKREMHFWQHEKILEYKAKYGKFPPLNLTAW